jgi:hypothetical protein
MIYEFRSPIPVHTPLGDGDAFLLIDYGVDVNTDAIPDGVGVGMVFRLQPAVVIKGDSYAFNKNWNTHGYAPVTASIYEKSCTVAPDSKNCKQRDVMLHGRITKPAWHALTFTAAAEQPATAVPAGATGRPV